MLPPLRHESERDAPDRSAEEAKRGSSTSPLGRYNASQEKAVPRDDDVTGLLLAWGQGDRAADSRLIEVLYQDLRRVARRRLSAERADHSLAPTALVHEAYMRLIDLRRVRWQNRAHFFAIAARVMRQILVDHARAHGAVKRGGARWTVPLTAHAGATTPREVHLLDLDAALDKLAAIDGRLADLVMLRFFGGLTVEESAEVLELSPATVKRDWARARAWLFRELRPVARSTVLEESHRHVKET
jgi:RNA polymerase sigma-70 factor, ECF subfamily